MAPAWDDAIDDILDGDLAVAMAHTTAAGGVVVTPITNFALRDRGAGTVTVLSSLGAWRKLERLMRAPQVALAFHSRTHGDSKRPEYVLLQGTATFSTTPDRAWLESIEPQWQRFMGSRHIGPLWDRWLRVYHWERIAITVSVRRVTCWPDLACRGEPTTVGAAPPLSPPPAQVVPAKGAAPRVDHRRAAARIASLPHTLLGWVGADGLPMVVPVEISGSDDVGMLLATLSGVPPGGRRAGLTSHWFSPGVLGQTQHVLTGWLHADDGRGLATYAPHTHRSYRLPPSRLLYRLLVGGFTRLGLRRARRAGFLVETPPG